MKKYLGAFIISILVGGFSALLLRNDTPLSSAVPDQHEPSPPPADSDPRDEGTNFQNLLTEEDAGLDYSLVFERLTVTDYLLQEHQMSDAQVGYEFSGTIVSIDRVPGDAPVNGLIKLGNEIEQNPPGSPQAAGYESKFTFEANTWYDAGQVYTFYYKPGYFDVISLVEVSNGETRPITFDELQVGDSVEITYSIDLIGDTPNEQAATDFESVTVKIIR